MVLSYARITTRALRGPLGQHDRIAHCSMMIWVIAAVGRNATHRRPVISDHLRHLHVGRYAHAPSVRRRSGLPGQLGGVPAHWSATTWVPAAVGATAPQ